MTGQYGKQQRESQTGQPTQHGNITMPSDLMKLSDSEYRISQSESYRFMARVHRAKSWSLFWLITVSVFVFDIAAAIFPEMISAPVLPGTLINAGFAIAFGAIALILAVSLYYLYWANQYRNRIDQKEPLN
ncbi:MAG: DUF485 domain-containing protein [Woeseia sp.]|jgi:uncharacterized membrane protein (DUF485 family)